METGAHLDSEAAHRIAGRAGAADRARRAIEGGQEPVAECLYLAAPVPFELTAHEGVVATEQVPPAAVTERGGLAGGVHDVREHHCREHAIDDLCRAGPGEELLYIAEDRVGITVEPEMVLAGQLDVLRTLDLRRKIASGVDVHDHVLRSMDHECRYGNHRKDVPDVD